MEPATGNRNRFQSPHPAVMLSNLISNRPKDATLACEGQSLPAHQVVLSAYSPYFQELLLNLDVNKHPIFILKDIKYSALQALMNYMYRCEVYVAQEYLESFLQAAQTLKIRGLPTWETMWMFSESEWGAGLGDPAGKGNIRTLPSDKHCSKSNYSTDTTSTDDDDEGTSTLDVSSPVVDAAPPSSGAIVNVEDEEDDSMSQSRLSESWQMDEGNHHSGPADDYGAVPVGSRGNSASATGGGAEGGEGHVMRMASNTMDLNGEVTVVASMELATPIHHPQQVRGLTEVEMSPCSISSATIIQPDFGNADRQTPTPAVNVIQPLSLPPAVIPTSSTSKTYFTRSRSSQESHSYIPSTSNRNLTCATFAGPPAALPLTKKPRPDFGNADQQTPPPTTVQPLILPPAPTPTPPTIKVHCTRRRSSRQRHPSINVSSSTTVAGTPAAPPPPKKSGIETPKRLLTRNVKARNQTPPRRGRKPRSTALSPSPAVPNRQKSVGILPTPFQGTRKIPRIFNGFFIKLASTDTDTDLSPGHGKAKCSICGRICRGYLKSISSFVSHLKKKHPNEYRKYCRSKPVRSRKKRQPPFPRILESEFYRLSCSAETVHVTRRKVIANCVARGEQVTGRGKKNVGDTSNFVEHLKTRHPDRYIAYEEKLPKHPLQTNEDHDHRRPVAPPQKRILHSKLFRWSNPTSSTGPLNAKCDVCGEWVTSLDWAASKVNQDTSKDKDTTNFIKHLKDRHPDSYKKFMEPEPA